MDEFEKIKIDQLFRNFKTINQIKPTLTMSSFTEKECCICYEQIGQTNNCVTGCGHAFCFKCLALAMAHKNSCPCCRAKLIDVPDEEADDDADSDYEESVDEGDDDIDDEGHVEDIVDRLEKDGMTMIDVVSMLLNRYSKRDAKYTNEHIGHINRRFDQLAAEVDMEFIEQQQFAAEDTRSIESPVVQDVRDIERTAIEALSEMSIGV
jgi:hypothetical protein